MRHVKSLTVSASPDQDSEFIRRKDNRVGTGGQEAYKRRRGDLRMY